MATTTHLRSLQAVEMALRCGSLQKAADALGITPAAVGQRVRALEDFLGIELLLRSRSGLRPTRELDAALGDLREAFAALERVSDKLDFQRTTEIHLVADPDWAELWLMPRLPAFRSAHPQILFCINGEGDVPLRLGAADLHIDAPRGSDTAAGVPLYRDLLLPIGTADTAYRMEGRRVEDCLEGFPLLHLALREGQAMDAGWADWIAVWGHRQTAIDRGVKFQSGQLALDGVRSNVGFFLGRLSFVLDELARDAFILPFPPTENLPAAAPYMLRVRPEAARRPQVQRFTDWLMGEVDRTKAEMEAVVAQAPRITLIRDG
ncbi:MAG: LysR family transcriptional regulator [Pseudomonadota bacterium]